MCGIFGISLINRSEYSSVFINNLLSRLIILSESRGKESAGVAVFNVDKSEINIYKDSIIGSELIRKKNYRYFIKRSIKSEKGPLVIIGHSRMVTNGSQDISTNNQPVLKSGVLGIHNGIVSNVDQLWDDNKDIKREYEVDTEVLLDLIRKNLNSQMILSESVSRTINDIEGSASLALLFQDSKNLVIGTNTGSLYVLYNSRLLIFASEKYIIEKIYKKYQHTIGKSFINRVDPNSGYIIDPCTLNMKRFNFDDEAIINKDSSVVNKITDKSPSQNKKSIFLKKIETANSKLLEHNLAEIGKLRRCTKCILPETFPYIDFDENGVCNYCRNHKPLTLLGIDKLDLDLREYRKEKKNPDCLVTFSGGRDSSYALHYIKTELKMNPIVYTYDWGMVTDLARRNQARLCGKLGIEQILVSANIARKRENIRKNILAWLKRPSLGTIPLFMAGDKQFFYYANKIAKQNKIDLIMLCENSLERTSFKSGFCGIKPVFDSSAHIYSLSMKNKIKMVEFYAKEFIKNPGYINSSILDTFGAFLSYYFIPHNFMDIYKYIEWKEDVIEKVLLDEYKWEISPDTKTTWRIGDGTASFYNYIYYTIAGFTENDTFRSNQIREGHISRDLALELTNRDNFPRFESIEWYSDIVGFSFNDAINKINLIPKLYRDVDNR
jgi:glutamine---fructose-6-phosphate transaminase (isomerizing)